MSVSGIEGIGFTPYVAPTVAPTSATSAAKAADGQAFGDLVVKGIDHLEGVQDKADALSVQAATGDLSAIHDYTIAATEAAVTTQLTVAMRNKAVEAFTEIMRMPI
ncbi:MAG: flagellar hook-basal body complex protein FliE [Nocardioidaceae bacterium]|nr:flagellar hook-basal body complex protein FliE [Nocardioidaceae bacterium]